MSESMKFERKSPAAMQAFRASHQYLKQRRRLLDLYVRRLCLPQSLSTCRRARGVLPPKYRRVMRHARALQEKVCGACGLPKPRQDFHKNATHSDGYSPRCKDCVSLRLQAWLARPGNRERTRVWAAEQRERIGDDPGMRAYHNRKGKAWRQANPDKSHAIERRHRIRRTKTQIDEYVDIDVLYVRDKGTCSLCGNRVDKGLTFPDPLSPSVEHTIPLSKGGRESYANTTLAHLWCNILKHTHLQTPELLARIRACFLQRFGILETQLSLF